MTRQPWTVPAVLAWTVALLPLALACGDKDDDDTSDDGSATVCVDAELPSEPAVNMAEPTLEGDDFAGSCNGDLMGDAAPDYGYSWTAPRTNGYTITTQGSSFDSVLFVIDGDCNGEVLACNDDISDDNDASQVFVSLEEGQTVVILIDGYDEYAAGTGALSIYEDL